MNPAGRVPGITVILQRGQTSIYEIPHVLSHLSPAGVVVELYVFSDNMIDTRSIEGQNMIKGGHKKRVLPDNTID